MPLPTPPAVSQMIKGQLTVAGAAGAVALGQATGAPMIPLHLMTDVALAAAWPIFLSQFLGGMWVGSVGSPSLAAAVPAPVPMVGTAQMQAACAVVQPVLSPTAASLAVQSGWFGPFAASIPLAIMSGVLLALQLSPFSFSAAPTDPVYTPGLVGPMDYLWPPLDPISLTSIILTAWQAVPDLFTPADRTLVGAQFAQGICAPLNSLVLTAQVLNASPPAVPVVPLTPYPYSLPPVYL